MIKKILTFHLTSEWYQKIASGEKTEEYREVSVYWTMRLLKQDAPNRSDVLLEVAKNPKREYLMLGYLSGGPNGYGAEDKAHRFEVLQPFTHVRFIHGYPKNGEPYIEREIKDITVDKPKKGMCPDAWLDKFMFVIKFKPPFNDIKIIDLVPEEEYILIDTDKELVGVIEHSEVVNAEQSVSWYYKTATDFGCDTCRFFGLCRTGHNEDASPCGNLAKKYLPHINWGNTWQQVTDEHLIREQAEKIRQIDFIHCDEVVKYGIL